MTQKLNTWITKTLNSLSIKEFTPIQKEALKIIPTKKNFIGISYTGTGKTLAFLLPILNEIKLEPKLQTIIILPTRELARQINNVLLDFKKQEPKLNTKLIIGGESINKQIEALNINPQIIVTTPDRFLEILKQNYMNMNFSYINSIILDEADMLLDLGFFEQIDNIISFVTKANEDIQKIAFSATFHDMLAKKLSKYFTNTEIVNLVQKNTTHQNIEHIIINNVDKYHSLSILLNKINPFFCLIFANKKEEVNNIYEFLKKQKRNVIKIHGDLQTRERKNSYKAIKNNTYQYVVCSDLLSRGMDIDGASHIISWNLPNELEWYFHRSGRTGRNKYTGYSYILNDNKDTKTIEKLIDKGVVFKWLKIKNNDLVSDTMKINKKLEISQEQKNEIQKVYSKKLKKKPGYKKQQKEEIEKINKKYRKQAISDKMKKQRIEQAKFNKMK